MGLVKENRGSIMVEFAFGGIFFIGFVLGMIVIGIWIYNASQVSQAARIAAHNVAVTNNPAESQNMALKYLNNTLIACPVKGAAAYSTTENGCGVAEAYMSPLFPGFHKLLDPRGKSTTDGRIHIRKEASRVLEYRFRPGSRQ
ncbi:MAG: pilus assembly protein [Firmicutes bacterium]|nr:pilus assembly protein [Bacillota bacterium]MCL5057221.1 pilus assembly protein [Actinomycetota bacterium]